MESSAENEKIYCNKAVDVEFLLEQPHARLLDIKDACGLLISPDTGDVLQFDPARSIMFAGNLVYPVRRNVPILLPQKLQPYFGEKLEVPFSAAQDDAFMQYFLLASIKQSGEINAGPTNEHYRRHLHRMRDLLKGATGLVLDVGCDNPLIGASLLPPTSHYIGLDPFCTNESEFRVIGVGEFLPMQTGSCNCVMFNTSLDHIMDWRRAIAEAGRVLVDGGILYVCSLVWTDNADLISDTVHFHHFREYELLGSLGDFEILQIRRYDYKGDSHRHGIYLSARKLGDRRQGI